MAKAEKAEKLVKIGWVVYKENKVPRVCKKCLHVFAGKLYSKFCSDICKETYVKPEPVKLAPKPKPGSTPRKDQQIFAIKPVRARKVKEVVDKPVKPLGRPKTTRFTEKICPLCGVPFVPHRAKQVNCTQKCYLDHKTANKSEAYKIEHTCLNCEAKFYIHNPTHKGTFCCIDCSKEHRRKTSSILLTCKNPSCGKEFRTTASNMKKHDVLFCCKQCFSEGRKTGVSKKGKSNGKTNN